MTYPKYLSLKKYRLDNINSIIEQKKNDIIAESLTDVVTDVDQARNLASDLQMLADLYDTRLIMQTNPLYKMYEEDDKPCDFLEYVETFSKDR